MGLPQADCGAVQAWFGQMEPGFVVSPCPAALVAGGTLREAVGGAPDAAALPARAWELPPAGTPPVAFFSGLSGEEQVALMEGWTEHTGLEAPAFASGKRLWVRWLTAGCPLWPGFCFGASAVAPYVPKPCTERPTVC